MAYSTIDFELNPQLLEITPARLWTWTNIRNLIDEFVLSTNIRNVDVSTRELWGLLPNSKSELRLLRDNSKHFYRLSFRNTKGGLETRHYRERLKFLVNVVRLKMAEVLTRANPRGWSKKAWGLYQSIQSNLGKKTKVYSATITFVENLGYEGVTRALDSLRKNLFWRRGLESVVVLAWHPRTAHSDREAWGNGRIHAHVLLWSRVVRTAREENAEIRAVDEALREGRYGVGLYRLAEVRGFLSAAAYLAWNYDSTLKAAKGPNSIIPPRAHLLRLPRNSARGGYWARIGKFSMNSSHLRAWRAAVAKYAVATHKDVEGSWQWTWRERKKIRVFLEPETISVPAVSGLDGFTYTIAAYGEDIDGQETYLLSNHERGAFVLTEFGLENLGMWDVAAGALVCNWRRDLTTGQPAIWSRVCGLHRTIQADHLPTNS